MTELEALKRVLALTTHKPFLTTEDSAAVEAVWALVHRVEQGLEDEVEFALSLLKEHGCFVVVNVSEGEVRERYAYLLREDMIANGDEPSSCEASAEALSLEKIMEAIDTAQHVEWDGQSAHKCHEAVVGLAAEILLYGEETVLGAAVEIGAPE